MPLTTNQQAAIDALDWLFDDHIQKEGRTTAIAIAAIRKACRRPGERVWVWDHWTSGLHERVRGLISTFVSFDPRLSEPRWSSKHFWLDLDQPIANWQPSAEFFRWLEERSANETSAPDDISMWFSDRNTVRSLPVVTVVRRSRYEILTEDDDEL